MEFNQLRNYLLSKKGTTEELPFGPDALVFKVLGKIFAIVAYQENPVRISLKCDPEHAEALRAIYSSVSPGYHLNKNHWNTVILNQSIPQKEIIQMIDESYDLVLKGLKKADREKISVSNQIPHKNTTL
jgi:predicted DNA-binding protein (MmcQ/YjbR family)